LGCALNFQLAQKKYSLPISAIYAAIASIKAAIEKNLYSDAKEISLLHNIS
jgi:hypothetical protein